MLFINIHNLVQHLHFNQIYLLNPTKQLIQQCHNNLPSLVSLLLQEILSFLFLWLTLQHDKISNKLPDGQYVQIDQALWKKIFTQWNLTIAIVYSGAQIIDGIKWSFIAQDGPSRFDGQRYIYQN